MNILYLLIGISLLAALVFLGLFIWAVRTGQYDDTTTPGIRVLFDDNETNSTQSDSTEEADHEVSKTKK
jgi:cbb3-type cytochrome oxidase maturation protein